MPQKNLNQTVIDIDYTEQDLLQQALKLIKQAIKLQDSSTVRKFEYLFCNLNAIERLQFLQAAGNVMYLDKWDNLLIESLKSTWKMEYRFKNAPS